MSFGITKTVPAKRGIEGAMALYDGTLSEFEFHMAGKPSRLNVGDYVYTIFHDQLIGRCQVTELIGGAVNPRLWQTTHTNYGRLPRRTARPSDSSPRASWHALL